MKKKSITLVKDWNGQKVGAVLPLVDENRAEVLVKRGVAEYNDKPEVKDENAKKPKAKSSKAKK